MNIASFQAISGGLQSMADALLRRRMAERQEKQEQSENQMKRALLDWQKQNAGDERTFRTGERTGTEQFQAGQTQKKIDAQTADRAAYYDALARGEITRGGQPQPRQWKDLAPAEQIDQLNRQIQGATQDFQQAQQQPGVTSDTLLPHQMKLSLLGQQRDALLNPPSRQMARVNVVDDDGTPAGSATIPTDQLATMGLKLMGNTGAPATAAPQLSAQDQQAMAWVRANSRDPRAADILKKLSGQ